MTEEKKENKKRERDAQRRERSVHTLRITLHLSRQAEGTASGTAEAQQQHSGLKLFAARGKTGEAVCCVVLCCVVLCCAVCLCVCPKPLHLGGIYANAEVASVCALGFISMHITCVANTDMQNERCEYSFKKKSLLLFMRNAFH